MSCKGVQGLWFVLEDFIMILKRKNKPQQFEKLLHHIEKFVETQITSSHQWACLVVFACAFSS